MAKYAQASSSNGSGFTIEKFVRQIAIYALPGTQIVFTSNNTTSTIIMGGTGTFQMNFGNGAISKVEVIPVQGSQHPIIVDYIYD